MESRLTRIVFLVGFGAFIFAWLIGAANDIGNLSILSGINPMNFGLPIMANALLLGFWIEGSFAFGKRQISRSESPLRFYAILITAFLVFDGLFAYAAFYGD